MWTIPILRPHVLRALMMLFVAMAAYPTHADVVTRWNVIAGEVITASGMGTPPANRVMALAHTAAYAAANAITKRYTQVEPALDAAADASVDAAIAAAHHAVLVQLVPAQRATIDNAYRAALDSIPDGGARSAGIVVGEKAAAAILARRADDNVSARESYRPHTTAGAYVPTPVPAAPQWPQRKPWLMTSAAQFRPGPPPALDSELWARDVNEIKSIGARNSTTRSSQQSDIARFWEATLPPIYHGLVRSVADMPGRDVTRNARLFAAVTQASDDALIAVFDAKYYYGFWRPITAIRNGDIDGNDATVRDPSWLPFVDTPLHPEYPCAHCIVSAAIGSVLEAEIGAGPRTVLTTASTTANGAARRWTSVDDFVDEVALARIYGGVHYRFSTRLGTAMGRQIGALVVAALLQR